MNRKIIWLEDSKEIIDIYLPILKKGGFDVKATTSVATALKLINQNKIDSLLLDIQFPNNPEEGITFLNEIKRNRPLLKVVVFSSYLSADKAMDLVNKNLILGYFKKPMLLEMNEVDSLINNLHHTFNKSILKIDDMNLKKIKIFVASSGTLNEERTQIEQYFSRKNDFLVEKGIYLQLMIWEKESSKFSAGRKQEEFNKLVLDSDIFYCLVFDKLGNFTKEEFEVAYKSFKNGNKPSHLFVFFKDCPISTSKITKGFLKVIELKEAIQNFHQFYSHYTSIEDLMNKVNKETDLYLNK